MDFDLTEDQKEIRGVAREVLAARSPWPKVREAAEAGAYDPALWTELVELGWPGIAVAEEHGGLGLGSVELAVLLEELGYACAATPFLSTAAAASAIQAAGSEQQRARWLPTLASGEATGGIGTPELAADAADAAVIVLLKPEGTRLLAREAAGVEPLTTIDPTRRFATVGGDGEPLGGEGAVAADRIHAAVAAEVVGLCQRALEMTLAFVRERKQFGTPVGAFQAVSHRCAEMLLATERSRSAVAFASWAADADPERLGEAAAMAKAVASDAGREVTAAAIQLHGGIGFTWEADVHWLYKRAQVDALLLGGPGEHRARLAALLGGRAAVAA
jgi:alkylation response protein AidB-like acyl-CoA dehydrogenase